MKTVVVIGGGITGLSTMYYLQKAVKANDLDVRLILIEAQEQLGGKICSVHNREFIIETGADSIVTRKENVIPFIKELGLEEEVVYNATGRSFLYSDGELKMIPEDAMFGIPMSLESLATTTLISAEGKVEALKDFYTLNDTFTKNDSVGAFLEHFLGRELVEKQISPVLSGVYSGKLNDLTIASTLPYLIDYKNEYGSIIRGLEANKEKFKGTANRKFLSFKNGLSTIINRLEEELMVSVEIIKGVQAKKIEKTSDRYLLTFTNYKELEADYVVLSTPDSAAKQLLQNEELNEEFNQFKNSSMISIYLGFDLPDSELPQDGTGFITTEGSDLICNACTWTSRKWSHTSKNHHLLVRLFYKSSSPHYERLRKINEAELEEVALADIRNSLGITGQPVASEITKWHNNMPNYHITHHQIVESLQEKMKSHYPNILLAGCSYFGVGIPDCIANGEKTAVRVTELLQMKS
ncbi:protoporphyrinogen oxidase [Peribacillus asahii]|uniref:Coproporphyrinogen III oxidase n=1 Tax=Peribacillus asahii TaxID=228899 RepID=A0A398B5F9_9BACI|nr:protoporphyrinogen oxidase [Peribacillus asahii]RID85092.1 protoporphyrinogen oxidase [Peribacillus asahii]